jgi:hypothetical protein
VRVLAVTNMVVDISYLTNGWGGEKIGDLDSVSIIRLQPLLTRDYDITVSDDIKEFIYSNDGVNLPKKLVESLNLNNQVWINISMLNEDDAYFNLISLLLLETEC